MVLFRADYGDDEYIRELIAFEFSPSAPCAPNADLPIEFTAEEDLQMLRLPQKECGINACIQCIVCVMY